MTPSDSYNQIINEHRARAFGWLDRLVFRQRLEILDTDPTSEAALQVIADLERFGKLFSLPKLLIGQLATELEKLHRKNVAIVEVCGGSCWFSRSLAAQLPELGFDPTLTGTDWSRTCINKYRALHPTCRMAWETADATALPYDDQHFDMAVNIQALHHFDPNMIVQVLKEMSRVARKVMLFDIRRTWYGGAFVAIFAPFYSREFIHDGIISHRRAYSVEEVQLLIAHANLPFKARRFLPFGMLITSVAS